MIKEKIIYFKDELNDDFADANVNPIQIDNNYKYIHKNIFWNICAFINYTLMLPIAYLYNKIVFNYKFVNKKVIKKYNKTGYFVYVNHTQKITDVFMPACFSFPKKAYEIVHPDNVSIPVQGKLNQMLGAMPLADTITGTKNLLEAMEYRLKKGNSIFIYPEAHIWPYCTKIRNYRDASFRYPVKFNTPVFCVTTTYQKRKLIKRPKIVAYVDGPFLLNEKLSSRENQKKLRDEVYNCMVKRSKKNTIEYVKYIEK